MATVKGPLHSTAASGQFGKAMIFQGYRNRHYVKRYAFPNLKSHPATPAQLAIQAQTKTLMQHWPDIAPADQATWDALAIPARIERVNAYLKENYRRLRGGQTALDGWPDIETVTIAGTLTIIGAGPTEDCLGDYKAHANVNGVNAYERIAAPVFYIYYSTTENAYVVGPDTGEEHYFLLGAPWPDTNYSDFEDPVHLLAHFTLI